MLWKQKPEVQYTVSLCITFFQNWVWNAQNPIAYVFYKIEELVTVSVDYYVYYQTTWLNYGIC